MVARTRTILSALPSFCLVFALLAMSACTARLQYLGQVLHSSTKSETVVIGSDILNLFAITTGETSSQDTITVFYVGGSGCTSLSVYLAPYFSGANAGLEVFGLDKSGVQEGDLGMSCSPEFWEHYTYDEILRRNLIALDVIRERRPHGPIVLVGTSEGGPISLEMAELAPDIARVAVIGAGGMTQRKELELLAEQRGALDDFQRIAARIDANPDSTELFALGYPHAYWSAVLDRSPARYLESLTMPILLIIGANDENVPVSSARFANSVLSNSQLVEWPDADHFFDTPSGNQRKSVMQRVGAFLLGETG